MSAIRHSLLDDALLGVEGERERVRVTLPELLARLSRGEWTEFTAIQAHQQHAWHAFLVQLAALALVRGAADDLPTVPSRWRELLVGTAKHDGAGEEAFALFVGDLAKPAFMQPPVPEGTLVTLKNVHATPSAELDVLVTSKNHDVKTTAVERPTPEHWTYALVTLQTMQGFLGAGNYGIARMNGGFASRPCVAFAPDHGVAGRFQRDVRLVVESRTKLLSRFGTTRQLGLVWCVPWDGKVSLGFSELDPLFIEVCRRVRLALGDENLVAHRGSSKVARIDSGETKGNTGDAWTPVSRKEGKGLTVPEEGFTYDRIQDLMFGDWEYGAANDHERPERYWLGQVLVRGQGKTGGYHERWIPVPDRARSFLTKPDARDRLGKRAQEWVQLAKIARNSILKPALLNLLQGGPDKLNFKDERVDRILAQLNQAIDAEFFHLLFAHAEDDGSAANSMFASRLVALAKVELERATTSVPLSIARRHRAIAFAYRSFWGAIRNNSHFPSPFIQAEPSEPSPSPQEVALDH